MMQNSMAPDLKESMPSRNLCDELVDGYLRTFEGVFRVLHVPSFRAEYEAYWSSTVPSKPSVILKILLVCAIGVPFYTGPDKAKLRISAAKWIHGAAEWQSAPHTKSRLNMAGLQIQILTLLARQVCNVDGDHVWIAAGALLRTAMHLGLHRDPSHYGKISIFHGEMRRRLWATVLEITAQSSLDMGMPPMISANDYDTRSPTNVNDEDFGEGYDTPLERKGPTVYTGSSIQIAFTQTLPVRLEIIRLLNNLRFDLPYGEVLRLGSELTRVCREKAIFFRSALANNRGITPFQIKLSDSMLRRFVLALYRPYYARASIDPQYHYARKVCLDNSLAILAPATEMLPGQEDDWTRVSHRSVGLFKSFGLYAMSTVYFELQSQIKEHQDDAVLFAPLGLSTSSSSFRPTTMPAQFYSLRGMLEEAQEISVARIRNGETNAKGAVFFACALARIDALITGADMSTAVLEAAKKATLETTKILKETYREEHGQDIDLSPAGGPFAGRLYGKGEGADDVTGRHLPTGTGVNDVTEDELAALNSDGADCDVLDSFGAMDSNMDLDLNAYLQGQNMSDGNGYHFARSPEWFFDLNEWAASGTSASGNSAFSM